MPSPITNRTSHRNRIVAEAVVSAYIRELAQPAPPRLQARPGDAQVSPARVTASAPRLARPRSHALELPRRRFLELSA